MKTKDIEQVGRFVDSLIEQVGHNEWNQYGPALLKRMYIEKKFSLNELDVFKDKNVSVIGFEDLKVLSETPVELGLEQIDENTQTLKVIGGKVFDKEFVTCILNEELEFGDNVELYTIFKPVEGDSKVAIRCTRESLLFKK